MNKTPQTSPVSLIQTKLPQTQIDDILTTLNNPDLKRASVMGGDLEWTQHLRHRNVDTASCPGNHGYQGMLWYYVMRMNHWNFQYDIDSFDADSIEYLEYGPGQHYTWHTDMIYPIKTQEVPHMGMMQPTREEKVRKISFTLLLNDEYEGGEIQFYFPASRNKAITLPKEKGLLILFDSRVVHRVRPVKKGIRKSMVGWVVGPRWR